MLQTQADARYIFNKEYRDQNFMTPEIVEYGWLKEDQIAYELSKGEGFCSPHAMYGVTILKRIGDTHKWEKQAGTLNKCFSGLAAKNDAICYIVRLKEVE